MAENLTYRVEPDGFYGELVRPTEDKYPGKALICFSGSDGGIGLARMLAGVFAGRGLTALALAYVMEEGLPKEFLRVPIDFLEAAAKRLHDMGYEKVGLWGISKGAELALTAGSLLPGLVNGVVAVAPMNTVCQGFVKDKGVSFLPGSSWSFHGEEIPYTPYATAKFPLGQVLRKSLRLREMTMYDLYLPLVEHPNPAAVIRAENITGPILLISSKMDTMWPSELAAGQIMRRLREQSFAYDCRHLSYDYGSHLFVPMELPSAKFFRGERGKNKEGPDGFFGEDIGVCFPVVRTKKSGPTVGRAAFAVFGAPGQGDSGSARVYLRMAAAAQNITRSSVTGMANQRESGPVRAGRSRIRAPLMTSPRATETKKAALDFRMAWK